MNSLRLFILCDKESPVIDKAIIYVNINTASFYNKEGTMQPKKGKTMTYADHFYKAVSAPSFLFFVFFAIVVYALIFCQEGLEWKVWKALADDNAVVAIRFTLVCVVVIVIMAGISHLDKHNPGVSKKIIDGECLGGKITAVVVSALMPGGAGGDQVKEAWESGDRVNALVCLTSMMALALNGFIFRSQTLGWKLSLIWAGMAIVGLVEVYLLAKLLKPWL